MSHLDDLKRKRAELDHQIAEAELSETEARKAIVLMTSYVKVVCTDCEGTGEVSEGGADIESDPPFSVTCPACHGKGWLYARKFEKRGGHDLEYHEVQAP